MKQVILLKLGEVVLKGLNRRKLEDIIIQSAKAAVESMGQSHVFSAQSTIYVSFDGEFDADEALDRLSRVFGVVALTKAAVCPPDFEEVKKITQEYLADDLAKAKTFKVIGKRAIKTYPKTSPEIGAELGAYLLEQNKNLSVDLHQPELSVYAEVREGGIYVHKTPQKGAGGLPCGSGGKGLLMLSGGLDSPVAGYLMARRGMKISAIHFESPPYTSQRALQKVQTLTKLMSRYTGKTILYTVHFTEIQEQIKNKCREDFFTIIMRRFMLRIACTLADKIGAGAIITGESLGQVASQTLEAIVCTDDVSAMPVFRPLIGLDKQDIVDYAYNIGTFETSTLPFEDCCTVFTPKHPKTKPRLEEIKREETKLNIQSLLENIEIDKTEWIY
ncbi:MAG: tRNA 4-thiouridine(8) synthase ThiI [Clostridiales bacterium]|nr:MAG: tRNA 4-thiouridine(8) synthase ThiI [Clostridiales bacterium]